MTTAIDQKAYLQKYLSGRSGDKKKKKKKTVKGKGFKIIDDDLDLSKMRELDVDELDILNEGEDAPQIAGIIDERPEELKKLEGFKTSTKWRVVNQDDGFNSKLQVEEVKRNNKEIEKENEIVFGKMYSDSEDEKKDSDPSPPRKSSEQNRDKNYKKNKKHNSDSDFSPPRRKDKRQSPSPARKKDDSDVSPPRKENKRSRNYNSDVSPPRKGTRKSRNDDSDVSPPRKRVKDRKTNVSDQSPPRKSKSHYSDGKKSKSKESEASPPRKRITDRKNYDSDQSPPRKYDNKPKRRKPSRWGDNESQLYQSRPSKSPENFVRQSRNKSRSPDRKSAKNTRKNRKNSDSDLSPPRKSRKRNSEDSDASPPRKRKSDKHKGTKDSKKSEQSKYNSDSDLSPPRRGYTKEPKQMEKTLDGKKAGLQDAKELKDENQAFRRREDEAFRNMTDEMSGRNAKAVSRKAQKVSLEERQKQKEKSERQKELDEKYKKWSKGVKQVEAQQAAVADFIHEASKPLARYKDDRDLEDKLRDEERDGDPMLQYMRDKKRERGELGPEKPTYKGNFAPNRFNIRPGYRWDGVDRSNGYEKKFFEQQSKRKAQEEEAYKWSTEDL